MASLGLARAVLDMGLRELVRSGNLIPPPVSLSPLCSFVIRMESLLEASQTGAGGTLLSIREEQARDYARGKKGRVVPQTCGPDQAAQRALMGPCLQPRNVNF